MVIRIVAQSQGPPLHNGWLIKFEHLTSLNVWPDHAFGPFEHAPSCG